jgi:hypothetical protein
MPAHRSEAEREIRDAVVSKLRRCRPNARIIHEINLLDGRVRCDVMAVDVAEIITVEIKSERDKLDRLAGQLDAMKRTSHTAIAALHRKFMPPVDSLAVPKLDGMSWDQIVWWHPKAKDLAEAHHSAFNWPDPPLENALQVALPQEALSLLHAHELRELCGRLGIGLPQRPNMVVAAAALRWGATGRDICRGICAALRSREWAAEADDPIKEDAA